VYTSIQNAKYLLGLSQVKISAIEIITTETADTKPQIIAALEQSYLKMPSCGQKQSATQCSIIQNAQY